MRPARALMLDAAVALWTALIVLFADLYHDMNAVRPVAAALSVAAGLSLIGRRRLPVATAVISAGFAFAVMAVDRGTAAYALLVPALALLSLALSGSRVRQWCGGLGCVAAVVLAEVVNPHRPGLFLTAQHLAWLIVPLLAAEWSRARRDYRSVLGESLALLRLTREQEAQRRVADERLRIARELHDVVAHTLTRITVQASVAGHLLDERPEQARHALSVIEEAGRDGIGELRAILGVLRETEEPADFGPAPGVDDVPGLLESARCTGLHAQLEVEGSRPVRVPEAVSLAAYRIVQESLTNVARHGAGAGVHVRLSFNEDELAIAVENTLPGRARHAHRPATDSETGAGVGILGMIERAQALGGTLTAGMSGSGFLVAARLPYRAG